MQYSFLPKRIIAADVYLFGIYKISLLIIWIFTSSCKAQNAPNLAKDSVSNSAVEKSQNPLTIFYPWQLKTNSKDSDPYFTETKNTISSFGPKSITRNMIQDNKGNIWLASWEGIIRYDGKSFTNFTNTEGLRRFHVFAAFEDKAGNLWFGTIGAGVYRYDGKTFTNFTTKEGLAGDRIGCFFEDSKGKIWIGTSTGISLYDANRPEDYDNSFQNFTMENGLIDNDINSIIEDNSGKIWVGARGEACYYDGKAFTKAIRKDGSAFENVRCIIKAKNGNIWLGGNGGLWRIADNTFTNYTTSFVGYIYEDRKGNIWTSSEAAANTRQWVLSRHDEKSLGQEKGLGTQILIQEGMFFGILEDKDGGIWLGTLNGVCRYDGIEFNCFK